MRTRDPGDFFTHHFPLQNRLADVKNEIRSAHLLFGVEFIVQDAVFLAERCFCKSAPSAKSVLPGCELTICIPKKL